MNKQQQQATAVKKVNVLIEMEYATSWAETVCASSTDLIKVYKESNFSIQFKEKMEWTNEWRGFVIERE